MNTVEKMDCRGCPNVCPDRDTERAIGCEYRTKMHSHKETPDDIIKNPSHYTYGNIECIDYIIDKELDFCLGNVVKYVTRAGHKDGNSKRQDLLKARQYLDFELEKVRGVIK